MNPIFVNNSIEELWNVLQTYNLAIWPMIIITYLLGIVAVILVLKQVKYSNKTVSSILAFLWLWVGAVFCIIFCGPTTAVLFGQTIPALWYMVGVLIVIQGALLLIFGVTAKSLSFEFKGGSYSAVGAMMIIYAMIVYPIIGLLTGHSYPDYPIFGVAPCPVTIFTFGLLLWTNKKVPMYVLIIPLIFSLVFGIGAVLEYGIWADVGLIISGIVGTYMILRHNAKITETHD